VRKEDQIGRCKSGIGFRGICCRHCGGKAGKPGYGRYFPSIKRSFEQIFYKQLPEHITKKCTKCPVTIKTAIMYMRSLEADATFKGKYGSRELLFKRIWSRLHSEDSFLKPNTNTIGMPNSNYQLPLNAQGKKHYVNIDWCAVTAGCQIVTLQQLGFVPHDEFIAMAQMKPYSVQLVSILYREPIEFVSNSTISFLFKGGQEWMEQRTTYWLAWFLLSALWWKTWIWSLLSKKPEKLDANYGRSKCY
jgi:hypothetical protein